MFEDDETLDELKRNKELAKRTFRKIINKEKLSSFEMDEAFNGF